VTPAWLTYRTCPGSEDAAPAAKQKDLIIVMVLESCCWRAAASAPVRLPPHGNKKHQAAKQEPPAPALYVALDPPFVSTSKADQQVRFLQVTRAAHVAGPGHHRATENQRPGGAQRPPHAVRWPEVLVVSTREGKEALRTQTLAAVRQNRRGRRLASLRKSRRVYFTSFVMQ